MQLPSTAGGVIGWVISTLILVAVGVFVLSRIPPVWRVIVATPSAAA